MTGLPGAHSRVARVSFTIGQWFEGRAHARFIKRLTAKMSVKP
jgi:hypothetical protein